LNGMGELACPLGPNTTRLGIERGKGAFLAIAA
jgi:hypothetical protein